MDISNNICLHDKIVEDWIDLDIDKSKQIFYCECCFLTFTHLEKRMTKPKSLQFG